MMSGSDKLKMAQESNNSPPVYSSHKSPITAPGRIYLNLQFKGFGGGVPINTETAAVKPRVGIAR
jgi:hypothetical protein